MQHLSLVWRKAYMEVLWIFLIEWNYIQWWPSFSLFCLGITVAYSIHELAKESLENKVKRITEKLILSSILVVLLNYLILNNLPHIVCSVILQSNKILSHLLLFFTHHRCFSWKYHHHWKMNYYLQLIPWVLNSCIRKIGLGIQRKEIWQWEFFNYQTRT